MKEKKMNVLKREILRNIFGSVKDEETTEWGIRKNKEF